MRSKKIFKLFSVMLMVMMLSVLPGCGSGSAEDQTQEDMSMEENGAYTELFEYNGLVMSVGQNYEDEESGNYMIDIDGNNTSESDYSYRVEAEVNGFPIHSYQSLILARGNQAGYSCAIPTAVLKEYGIEKTGQIDYHIVVNEFDMENFETGEQVYVSENYTIKTDNFDSMDKEPTLKSTLYEDENIQFNMVLKDGQVYSSMYVYAVNKGTEDAEISVSSMNLNGEALDLQNTAEVYTMNLAGSNVKFAILPLMNYEYNEETMETTTIPVESLDMTLDVTVNGETYTTPTISYE